MRIAYSTHPLRPAVADLKRQLGCRDPRAVVCFASTRYDPAALSRELAEAFPKACTFGCSTAGELVSGQMLTDSVVAMCLDADVIDGVACAVATGLRSGAGIRSAIAELEARFGASLSTLDPSLYAGLVLIDGMSGSEERIIEEIGDRTDLFFVGGSAGDDLQFQRAWVFANGQAWSDAALLSLLKVRRGFDVIKTQSFTTSGKALVATHVDQPSRKVLRFNGKPAAEAYAEALGVPVTRLADHFMRRPLGLMNGSEPFVRSPQRIEDGAVVFYCQIFEGAELEVLQSADIVADTRSAIQSRLAELGHISGIIDFNCILRTLELRSQQRSGDYGALFDNFPAIGFSTYGEAFLGHINQTSTMLVLR